MSKCYMCPTEAFNNKYCIEHREHSNELDGTEDYTREIVRRLLAMNAKNAKKFGKREGF